MLRPQPLRRWLRNAMLSVVCLAPLTLCAAEPLERVVLDVRSPEDCFGIIPAFDGTRLLGMTICAPDPQRSYLFERIDGAWQSRLLEPSSRPAWIETGSINGYGRTGRAIEGDLALVASAYEEAEDGTPSLGAVYLYERDSADVWRDTRITASDVGKNWYFGISTCIHERRLVVGAMGADEESYRGRPSEWHGAVYVYDDDGAGGWTETKLQVPSTEPFRLLGATVDLEGDRIVAGAPANQLQREHGSGEVWVFDRDPASGDWSSTRLVASDTFLGHSFGTSLDLDGERLAVVAHLDDEFGENAGAVYIFERDSTGAWLERTKIGPSSPGLRVRRVQLAGDRLVVSQRDPLTPFPLTRGVIAVLDRALDGTWSVTREIDDPGGTSNFGAGIALAGSVLAAGAPGDDESRGAIYLVDLDEPAPRFELSLELADDAATHGQPGTTGRLTWRAVLDSVAPGDAGAQAWSFGVEVRGGTLVDITTDGTAGADTEHDLAGHRASGFAISELAAIDEGGTTIRAVSAVVLSTAQPVTLPPRSRLDVARIAVEIEYPAEGECLETGVEFLDGVAGSGEPVPIIVTWRDTSCVPTTSGASATICGLTGRWVSFDCNGDGALDISDAVCELSFLFLGGEPSACRAAMDFGGDGAEDISDAVAALSYLFGAGRPPSRGAGCQVYLECESTGACGAGEI